MRVLRLSCFPFLLAVLACATTTQTIPKDWLSVPRTTRIRSVALSADGKVSPSSQPEELTLPKRGIEVAGNAIARAGKPLTTAFKAVDSFDVSEARGEVVFSAKRENDFDIGLVATEGSEISWVPADPADEVAVEWAPRGSKISYIVRSRFSDIVRTLHVPTAFSFGVDFPFSRVQALGWDPQAERYAVAYSSPITSDAVDVLRYSGEQRTPAVPPEAKLDFDIQPFAGEAILLQPFDVQYGEKLPVVIWYTGDLFSWNDARAELLRTARVALIVTSHEPDAAFLQRVKETAILDASRVFAVNCSVPGATAIASAQIAAGKFRRNGQVVSVGPGVVESFAAHFIADQLKRNSPPNGSR